MRSVRNRLTYRGLRAMLWSRDICDLDWLEAVWAEVKDRPISQGEMAAAMKHCATGPPRRKRLHPPKLVRFLACKPRLDIITHTRTAEIADEVVARNEGAFKRLAKT